MLREAQAWPLNHRIAYIATYLEPLDLRVHSPRHATPRSAPAMWHGAPGGSTRTHDLSNTYPASVPKVACEVSAWQPWHGCTEAVAIPNLWENREKPVRRRCFSAFVAGPWSMSWFPARCLSAEPMSLSRFHKSLATRLGGEAKVFSKLLETLTIGRGAVL